MNNFNSAPGVSRESKSEGLIKDLFVLSGSDFTELKDCVERNKGIVRIMVHPYFVEQKIPDPGDRIKSAVQGFEVVEKGFKNILQVKSSTPVFLFEGYNQIPNTREKISPILKESGRKIYFIPTFPDDSIPFVDRKSNKRGQKRNWNVLIETMKLLGVKKIMIGGMTFIIRTNRFSDGLEGKSLDGCMGDIIEKLKGDFEIEVSNLAYPQSRKDLNIIK